MKIVYTNHLKRRIKERGFPKDAPKKIYKESRKRYFDTETKRNIAISKLKYAGRNRNIMISYDKINNRIEIITIHPISENEIGNRVKLGRWKENEK